MTHFEFPAWLRGRAQAFKRDVYIRDNSGTSVNVTLWGAYCTSPGDQLEEVRGCIVLRAVIA